MIKKRDVRLLSIIAIVLTLLMFSVSTITRGFDLEMVLFGIPLILASGLLIYGSFKQKKSKKAKKSKSHTTELV